MCGWAAHRDQQPSPLTPNVNSKLPGRLLRVTKPAQTRGRTSLLCSTYFLTTRNSLFINLFFSSLLIFFFFFYANNCRNQLHLIMGQSGTCVPEFWANHSARVVLFVLLHSFPSEIQELYWSALLRSGHGHVAAT